MEVKKNCFNIFFKSIIALSLVCYYYYYYYYYFGPTCDTRTRYLLLILLILYVETCSFDQKLNGCKEPLKIEAA